MVIKALYTIDTGTNLWSDCKKTDIINVLSVSQLKFITLVLLITTHEHLCK
jgi:hypothetical protein